MILVREYALLTTDTNQVGSLDVGVVSAATFDWLLGLQKTWRGDSELLALQSRQSIKLGSYVGYLQSPSGECIEVLPKTKQQNSSELELTQNRNLLRDMLLTAMQLKPRMADSADLLGMHTPLHEWIISQYLSELNKLVRRGLRFDYQQVEEESRFIRGQLNQVKQSQQPPDRANWFHIRHDIYTPNRIENRLLKTALDDVLKITKNGDNWRLANVLCHHLSVIEPSQNPQHDLQRWQDTKFMQPYNAIKPWCELILEKLNPNFQQGFHPGISLLFPMEKLFEGFVGFYLGRSLAKNCSLKTQARSKFLMRHTALGLHKEQSWFQLQPDFFIHGQCNPSVLDAKWKLIDDRLNSSKSKYKIAQNDLYQLFAYGHKYLHAEGQMMLIYPKHPQFEHPLPVFSYDARLHLWVVPFDCDARCLVEGDWQKAFPSMQPQDDAIKSA